MPLASDSLFQYPSYPSLREKEYSKTDHIEVVSDDDLDIFGTDLNEMAGSPGPFIKDEPTDLHFNSAFQSYNMEQQFSNHGQHFGQSHDDGNNIDPSALHNMNPNFNSGQFNSNNSNMTGSFSLGHSGIGDDELQELSFGDNHGQGFNNFNDMHHQQQGVFHDSNGGAVNIHQGNQGGQMFSSTPEGSVPFSPFANPSFAYPFHHGQPQSLPQGIVTQGGSMPNGAYTRPRMNMERQASDTRSPMTPKSALQRMHIGTPENSNAFGAHPMMHRQNKSVGSHWDGTPGSGNSFLDSPMPSPHQGSFQHPNMNEILGGKHPASLPVKSNEPHGASAMQQTQEAKRKKRRESHNAVERRRRDNINERIHDLSRLVPQHRLDDEKVRKHIHNNGSAMSPSLGATGMSPPNATSLLAGGTGRRAAGNITTGLPIEDKDKGPNKGDILNGAVSWTRDLMWILHEKIRREEELKNYVTQTLKAEWPYPVDENEVRMQSELLKAIEKNDPASFSYSRNDGSGLRVPGHTHMNGDRLSSSQSLSPAMQSGNDFNTPNQAWSNNNHRGSFDLKEEDEDFGMTLES